MKESHHHIARIPSFSIMEEIILSKVKCTNISEVKPSDLQQAKGPFYWAAFTRGSRHIETSSSCAFSWLLNNFAKTLEPVQLLFIRAVEFWKFLRFIPVPGRPLAHQPQHKPSEFILRLVSSRCNTETIKYQLNVQYVSAWRFPHNSCVCEMCCLSRW